MPFPVPVSFCVQKRYHRPQRDLVIHSGKKKNLSCHFLVKDIHPAQAAYFQSQPEEGLLLGGANKHT